MLNKSNKKIIIIGSIIILMLIAVVGVILWYSNNQNNNQNIKIDQSQAVEKTTTEKIENSKTESLPPGTITPPSSVTSLPVNSTATPALPN